MDDRFDRRELLLHLGDMLQAVHLVTSSCSPDDLIGELATRQESLQDVELLQMVAPTMTVAEFAARTASALRRWPTALLETELDRNALVSTVEKDLFEGNPDGWNAYVTHLRKKVAWFGKSLSKTGGHARNKRTLVAPVEEGPAEPSDGATPDTEQVAPKVKTTWPWPRRDAPS
jgi:hypothetical protein